MSTGEQAAVASAGMDLADETNKPRLDLTVDISETGPCRKHVRVTISRADIDRQFADSLGTLSKEAFVKGFRSGKAPRHLVEKRYRKEMGERVKGALLMAALEQLDNEHQLNPLKQPTLDVEAIVLPEKDPMVFELDIETAPNFEVPDYKTISIRRPVYDITKADISARVDLLREQAGAIIPKTGDDVVVELGDYLVVDITLLVRNRDPITLKELTLRLAPTLRFQDVTITDLDKSLVGAKRGESREAVANISIGPEPTKTIITVLDIKKIRTAEMNLEFLSQFDCVSEGELNDKARLSLLRQCEHLQRKAVRKELVDTLLTMVDFDLPPDMVAERTQNTLANFQKELKKSGVSGSEIKSRLFDARADLKALTERTLKENFLLQKIAASENIKIEDEDIEEEIRYYAETEGESVRRMRSHLEKNGLIDDIAALVVEHKTIDKLLTLVQVEDVPTPVKPPVHDVEALDFSVLSSS